VDSPGGSFLLLIARRLQKQSPCYAKRGCALSSDSSVGRAGDCSDDYFAALTNPPQVAGSIPAQKNLVPVGLIAQLVRALGCYYVVFRGRPWICVVVVTYPTHMFAAYTGKSWVQPPVGPPFFISFYDLKNDFCIFGRYIFGKYNGRSRRAVSQGNDSCDAEVSSATPSTYMVGPMFLVSLQHMFITAVCCKVTRRPFAVQVRAVGYVGQGGQETLILDDPPSSRIF